MGIHSKASRAPFLDLAMVRRLVAKDLYLHWWAVAIYPMVAMLELFLLGMANDPGFWIGIGLGLPPLIFCSHLPASLTEGPQGNLPFVMSLPISAREYAAGKILANLLIFLIPWTVLLAGSIFLIGHHAAMADGLIPWAVLVLVSCLACYCLVLGIGLVAEYWMWLAGAAAILFMTENAGMGDVPHFGPGGESAGPAFSGHQLGLLALLVVASVLLLLLAFYQRSRHGARLGLFSGKEDE